ncbi:MAG: biopolymer transporter ExbD [candidate division WOR-3 bacterium]|jgi:biopolymer transport protein TolR|nr:biopolymer transporter ExbD [candidate division WOR-3 bacterium]MCR4423662.1 biopolymer transporter ExbD [candidate division WOR-3 bacterium]MDH7519001.1 biopolymer transporter ExbD [bacterium]
MKERRLKFLAEMNITSLADVSFTLMIIFLIAGVSAALSRQQGIDLDLPRTSRPEPQTRAGLVISVKADGQIFVGTKAVSMPGLAKAISDQLARGEYDRVYLHADRRVDYGTIIEILGIVREQGISNIGLTALPK